MLVRLSRPCLALFVSWGGPFPGGASNGACAGGPTADIVYSYHSRPAVAPALCFRRVSSSAFYLL